jgi:hypothetical protein
MHRTLIAFQDGVFHHGAQALFLELANVSVAGKIACSGMLICGHQVLRIVLYSIVRTCDRVLECCESSSAKADQQSDGVHLCPADL